MFHRIIFLLLILVVSLVILIAVPIVSASELVSEKRWWNGPEFLFKDEREWPQEDNIQSDNENDRKEIIQNPATTTHALSSSTQVTQIGVHQIVDVNRYSSWKKLLRVTAYVLRFTRRSRKDKSLELRAEEVQLSSICRRPLD